MRLYSEDVDYKLYHGNMLDMLEVIQPNSIDSIVCDPPYGLTSINKRCSKEGSAPIQYGKDGSFQRLTKGFMGKEWDGSGIEYNVEAWSKCYKVLKPGGFLLAFGGTRTFHRIACAIEDAGFEIRDTIMYLYGSGFPKSLNIGLAIDKKNGVDSQVVGNGKSGISSRAYQSEATTTAGEYEIKQAQNEWAGWGTALKPAYEPIIVARKPCVGSVVNNVQQYSTGGINIDECRVGSEERTYKGCSGTSTTMKGGAFEKGTENNIEFTANGRYPANVIHDGSDEATDAMPNTTSYFSQDTEHEQEIHRDNADILKYGYSQRFENGFNDEGSASRYFYCAKASKKDRDEGLDAFEGVKAGSMHANIQDTMQLGGASLSGNPKEIMPKKNTHPTVKPVELMQYLIRLVTPKNGTILDCFMGSGSTGKAAMFENRERNAGYKFIGIELTEEYLPICKARIDYGKYKYEYDIKQEQANDIKERGYMQPSIFDFYEGE